MKRSAPTTRFGGRHFRSSIAIDLGEHAVRMDVDGLDAAAVDTTSRRRGAGCAWACGVSSRPQPQNMAPANAPAADEVSASGHWAFFLHSITSSVRASSVTGMVRPSALAVIEIDNKVELGRLLDRQVGGLGAAQYLVHVVAGAADQVQIVRPVGHQAAGLHVLALHIHGRHASGERKGIDASPIEIHQRIADDIKGGHAALERFERGRDVRRVVDWQWRDLNSEAAGRGLELMHFQQLRQNCRHWP